MAAYPASSNRANAHRYERLGFVQVGELRELEFRAGAERRVGSRSLKHKSGYHQQHNRDREREIAAQAELAYSRLVTDWSARTQKTARP